MKKINGDAFIVIKIGHLAITSEQLRKTSFWDQEIFCKVLRITNFQEVNFCEKTLGYLVWIKQSKMLLLHPNSIKAHSWCLTV